MDCKIGVSSYTTHFCSDRLYNPHIQFITEHLNSICFLHFGHKDNQPSRPHKSSQVQSGDV